MVWLPWVICGILVLGLGFALGWIRLKGESQDLIDAGRDAAIIAQTEKIEQLEKQLAEKWAKEKADVEKRIGEVTSLPSLLDLARELREKRSSSR